MNSNLFEIDRVDNITYEQFQKKFVKKSRPVIINHLVDNWSSINNWNFEYISNECKGISLGTIPLKDGYLDLNDERGSKFLCRNFDESYESIKRNNIKCGWTIASPLEYLPKKLISECPPPQLCASEKYLRGRFFMGAKNVVTSLHQDLFDNLYTVVIGCKRIYLFSPSTSVYRYAPWSKLPNHAKVNPENPDYNLYPKFRYAKPIIVDLKAGETIYIPSFWWHHLRNIEPTIAVSFWWSQGWKLGLAWMAASYKRIRNI